MKVDLEPVGILVMAAMAAYLAAVAAFWLRRRAAWGLYGVGFAAALAAFIGRWIRVEHVPLKNLYEVCLTMGMLMLPLSVFCRRVLQVGVEAADAAIGVALLFPVAFVFGPESKPLVPALQSPLFIPHVSVYLVAYVVLAKAAVQALGSASSRARRAMLVLALPRVAVAIFFYYVTVDWIARLFESRAAPVLLWVFFPCATAAIDVTGRLLGEGWRFLVVVAAAADVALYGLAGWLFVKAQAQSLETQRRCEQAAHRMVGLGFPLLTLGLLLGAVWGKFVWDDYWHWDPKELWSLVSWLVFVAYLHWRGLHGLRYPRLNAALVVLGAVCILVTLFWANLSDLFKGLHSYA